MPVSWTEWIPKNLRTCWKRDENNLKASSTTNSYAGGNPATMYDIKPSIVDYSTGLLREGVVLGDALKQSVGPFYGSDINPPSDTEGGWNNRPGDGTSDDGKYVLDTSRTGTRRVLEPGRAFNLTGTEYVRFDNVWTPSYPFTMTGRAYYGTGVNVGTATFMSVCSPDTANRYATVWTTTDGSVGVTRRDDADSRIDKLTQLSMADRWFHWAVAFLGPEDTKGWVNGFENIAVVGTTPCGISTNATSVLIGMSRIIAPNFFYTGLLHDSRIYNRELTDNEVMQITKTGDVVDLSSLVFWDKCESVDPVSSWDSSGNGAVGSKINFVSPTNFFEGSEVPKSYQNDNGYSEGYDYTKNNSQYHTLANQDWPGLDPVKGEYELWFTVKDLVDSQYSGIGSWSSEEDVCYIGYNESASTIRGRVGRQDLRWLDHTVKVGESFRVRIRYDLNGTQYMDVEQGGAWVNVDAQPWNGNVNGVADDKWMGIGRINTTTSGGTGGASPCNFVIHRMVARNGNGDVIWDTRVNGFGEAPSVQPTPVLIPRDESDTDFDVAGNDLQFKGECPRDIRIRQSACASFDGVAADVRVPSRVGSTTATSWDWEGLIYAPVLTTATSYIVANRGGSGGWAIVGQSNGDIYIQRGTGSGYEVLLQTDDPIPVNTWLKVKAHMESQNWVLQVEDAETGKLFFYGTENTKDFVPTPSLQAYFLGSLGGASPWEGSIADAKLYLDGNPRCFLPLSEGSGTTCHNVLQNDFHGTVRNTTEVDFWQLKQDQFHYNLINGWGERERFDPVSNSVGDGFDSGINAAWVGPGTFSFEQTFEDCPYDSDAHGIMIANGLNGGFGTLIQNSEFRFYTGSSTLYLAVADIEPYEGQKIVCEWDGTNRTIKANGVTIASDTQVPTTNVSATVQIGQGVSGVYQFDGRLKDLKLILNGSTVLDMPRVQVGQRLANPLLEGSRPANWGTVPDVWQQYNIGGALDDDGDSVASNGIVRIRSAQSTGTSRGGIFLSDNNNIINGRRYTLRVRVRINSYAGGTPDLYAFVNGSWLQVMSTAEVVAWEGHWLTVTKELTAGAVTDGNFIIASRLVNAGDELDYTLASVLLTDAEVPALLDGSTTADGGEITYDSGNWHNNANTEYDFQQEADAPWHDKIWTGYVYTNNGPQGINVDYLTPALAGTDAFTLYALVKGGSGNTIGRIISSGVTYRLDTNLYRSAASLWVQVYDGSAPQDFTDLIPVDNEWQELVVQWNATEMMAWLNGTKSSFTYPTTYNPANIDRFGLFSTYLSGGTAPLIDHYVGRIRLVTEAADPNTVLKVPALADWIFNDGLIEDYSGNGYHLLNNEPDVITPIKATVPDDHNFNEFLDPEAWQKRYVDRTQEDNYLVRRNLY